MNAFFVLVGIIAAFLGGALTVLRTESIAIVRENPDGRKFVKVGGQMYWLVDDQKTHGEAD